MIHGYLSWVTASPRQFGPNGSSSPGLDGTDQQQDHLQPHLQHNQDIKPLPCHPLPTFQPQDNDCLTNFPIQEYPCLNEYEYFTAYNFDEFLNSNLHQLDSFSVASDSFNQSTYYNINQPYQLYQSNGGTQSNEFQLPAEVDQFSSPATTADCYTEQLNTSFPVFSLEVLPNISLQNINQTNIEELPANTNQKIPSPIKLTNKERCKKYRNSKKIKEANLIRELAEELQRHEVLERKAMMMEKKVLKWKQMLIRLSRKQAIQSRIDLSDAFENLF